MSHPAARTATDLISKYVHAFLSRVATLTEKKYWLLYAGLGALLFSWICRLPEYYALGGMSERIDSKFLTWQAQHPLTPNTEYLKPLSEYNEVDGGIVSHLYKTSYRLTVPLLSRVLPFGVWSWVVLPGLCGLIFFPIFCGLLAQFTGNRVTATLLTWSYAVCSGAAFFFGGFYIFCGDGVAYLLLAVAAFSSRPWVIFTSLIVANFTDERAVIATVLIYFLRTFQNRTLVDWKLRELLPTNGAMWAMIAANSSYLLARFALHKVFGLANDDSSVLTSAELLYHLRFSIPDLLFSAYEGLWVLPILALLSTVAARNVQWAVAYAGMLLLAATSFLVIDLERSFGYMFPVLIAAIWALRGEKSSTMQYILTGILVVNIAWCDIKESAILHLPHLLFGRGA